MHAHELDPAAVDAVFAPDIGRWIAQEAPLSRERYTEWRNDLIERVYRYIDPNTEDGRDFMRPLAAVDDTVLAGNGSPLVYVAVEAAALNALAETTRPVGLTELMPWAAVYAARRELAQRARKKYEW